MTNMRRDFINRQELIEYLKEQFPDTPDNDHISETRGGRAEAEKRLNKLNPQKYAKTRNYFDGDVTYLSPYIRHGVISLAEVRDYALAQVNNPFDTEKFISELGWRDYWQRLYAQIGDAIWVDREPYKTGYHPSAYEDTLPKDIENATTGLACIDAFSNTLRETGYLHNHARMYLASYIVHHRKIKWQAGARWFLTHLLDGDPASNNLSWQWVASTFSQKPYFFNRENLEKFTGAIYCTDCPLYGKCDFEGTYEALETNLFPNMESSDKQNNDNQRRKK
ncbi:MAG TPA: FAD-binding domain-containing protein [Aggregatilineales bacterium]|nr:FAD-binding domain-containing protein [Aggregatilineales bacterium]